MMELAALKQVPFLAMLDEPTLERLRKRARRVKYAPGACLVSELEPGADVFVIVSGEAEVTVDARDGTRRVLRKLEPGSAFGEMSSLTGALRSATVSALTALETLVIADADFDRLRETHPAVALELLRELAERLQEVEQSLETLLTKAADSPSTAPQAQRAKKGSLLRVWRELVVAKQRDCAFLTLAAFVLTLLVVRFVVWLAFTTHMSPADEKDVLRLFYLGGFALLGVSSCASLLTFRIGWRRAIALAYGIGVALIFNELGVTLAFDIFFKDIHTADPNHAFNIERLYRRTQAPHAIAIGLVVLIQAAYLRGFYRRAAFVVMTRIRRLRK
jgi:CRP-like cAMP-binding protein